MFHNNGRNIDNSKFYNLLGVEKNADTDQIKKAYRKKAMQHHPDRGGDEETFKEISRAYEVLSDQQKREIYDQAGEEGLNGNHMDSQSADDIFNMFFGGGNPFGGGGFNVNMNSNFHQQRNARTNNVVHQINVDLKDLYSGTKKTLRIKRKKVVKTGKVEEMRCPGCDGKGVKIQIRRMGPMVQQTQRKCDDCGGTGKTVKGKKLVEETKELELVIEKGMKDGDKMVLSGMADESLTADAGDIVFVIREGNNSGFIRKDEHLLVKKDILLADALCGYSFKIRHINGSDIYVESDSVVSPGKVYSIPNKGMPIRKCKNEYGNMYVIYNIIFPQYSQISKKVKTVLKDNLPSEDLKINDSKVERNILIETDDVKIDNDSHHSHQQNMECNQQ